MTCGLTIVGLGPGDPELITLKGLRAIEAADIVFVPRGDSAARSLALDLSDRYLDRRRQEIVEITFPVSSDQSVLATAWRSIADDIASQIGKIAGKSGRCLAVYPMLGDPMLFGTAIYLLAELAEHHPEVGTAVIPGVTSFAMATALAQLPLASGEDRVAIVPASRANPGALERLLDTFETVVILKLGKQLPRMLETLGELDLLSSALFAERLGMPGERIVRDLATLDDQSGQYFSLLVVRSGEKLRPAGAKR